ncbi:MAG: glyoxalase/bleomycin resistance/extradiol dioxygenase family protein [Sphingobacteriales bacterium]|nr:MAG: glyoxalase/bleomycin resistance/extradiol dioxygenase family protein [Sphingobacteriales bacterium]
MKKQIFINLPVADLTKAKTFYEAIGFVNNPQFTDNTAACMVLSEEIFVMLLTHDKFSGFTQKQIADTNKTVAVINSLSCINNDEVNKVADKALAAGGKQTHEPMDYGFMYQRSFADLDGHHWEVFYMDLSKFPNQ